MGAGLEFGLALAPNMSGSMYSSVSLLVVCIRCVMYLSCLSTLSVKWSICVTSVRNAFMISTRKTSVGVESGPGKRDLSPGSSAISKSTIRPRNLREIIMHNSCQERFRSLVRDTSLPLRITLVYLKTTTAYVKSKLLAQRQCANKRAVVT